MKTRNDFESAAAQLQDVFRLSASQREAIQSELLQAYRIGAADRRSVSDGAGSKHLPRERAEAGFRRDALRIASEHRILDEEIAPAVATAALAPLQEAVRDAYGTGFQHAADGVSIDSAVASVLKRITYYTIHPAEPRSFEQLKIALHAYALAIIEQAKREVLAEAAARSQIWSHPITKPGRSRSRSRKPRRAKKRR